MKMPVFIFRAGDCTARKHVAFLLVLALLLACSVRLYRMHTQEQDSMEVFADGERAPVSPQGLYALLEQLLED